MLISARPEDQAFAEEVAKFAGLTYQCAPDFQQAGPLVSPGATAAILVDAPTAESYAELERAIGGELQGRIHALSSESLEKAAFLAQGRLIGHYIVRNYGDPAAAGRLYGRALRAVLGAKAFGLAPLFPEGTQLQSIRVDSKDQKEETIETIKRLLLEQAFQSRVASTISNAVDELLMNALFDAPVDEKGQRRYQAITQEPARKLEGREVVELGFAFDGQYVGISVADGFGSLEKASLLSRLARSFRDKDYTIGDNQQGAGLGLATVYQSGASLIFRCEPGTRTEVTAFFRRTESYREFREQFRFISTVFY